MARATATTKSPTRCSTVSKSTAGRRTRQLSNGNFHPHRSVVAGFLPAARGSVDAGSLQALRERGAEQGMIDADAGGSLERVPPIMPEGVDPFVRMQPAQRIGPALGN